METHFTPELEKKPNDLVLQAGRTTDDHAVIEFGSDFGLHPDSPVYSILSASGPQPHIPPTPQPRSTLSALRPLIFTPSRR
jgi:hypothetical protein